MKIIFYLRGHNENTFNLQKSKIMKAKAKAKTKTIKIWEEQMRKYLTAQELNLKERTEDLQYHKRKLEIVKIRIKETAADIALTKQQITETKNRINVNK